MRILLLSALSMLLIASVAFSQQKEFNKTGNVTCHRKDPFDEYIYHAPQLSGITVDGDPSDWDQYPLLDWAPVDHWCEGTGKEGWPAEVGGWNYPVDSPEDFSCEFKAGWGMADGFPVLYVLAEWIDDSFHWEPGAAWNHTDILEFTYGETSYDADGPVHVQWPLGGGWGRHFIAREMNLYLVEGWGIRLYKPEANPEGSNYWLDEKQPLSIGEIKKASDTKAYLECQLMLFQDYEMGVPWSIVPGMSCLGVWMAVCEYDVDGSFSFLTWGLFNSEGTDDDGRVRMSTIGFEKSYAEMFGVATVERSAWGAIKNAF